VIARLMGLRTLAPAEVLRSTREGRTFAFDVNSRESWLAARVPGSVNLDPVSFAPAALPADKTATLVFYCSNPLCSKAPRAAVRAKQFGYEDVRVMSAGIKGWMSAGLPIESGLER
jgi:rhodanese-related sulfurtransferase